MNETPPMKVSEFRRHLQAAASHELHFVMPDGGRIPVHAHITEVGRTDRRFLDCGGTLRNVASCTLQAWVAEDIEHRLLPGKLLAILERAEPILEIDGLDVEVEYEDGFLSQFPVLGAKTVDGILEFHLGTKHTDCLARELCLPAEAADGAESCCQVGGGCC
jgi:hypothetical protein